MFVRPPFAARAVFPVFLSLVLAATGMSGALAQTGPAPDSSKPKKHNKYGSPLDTIMSTRLWTNAPPAQDFVQKTHPDVSTLKYTPMTGYSKDKDPDRPKPRDPANIQALQAELEQDLARNQKKAQGLGGATAPSAKHVRKAGAKAKPTSVSTR